MFFSLLGVLGVGVRNGVPNLLTTHGALIWFLCSSVLFGTCLGEYWQN